MKIHINHADRDLGGHQGFYYDRAPPGSDPDRFILLDMQCVGGRIFLIWAVSVPITIPSVTGLVHNATKRGIFSTATTQTRQPP